MRLPRFCSASGIFGDARTVDLFAFMRKRTVSLMSRLRGSINSLLTVVAEEMHLVMFLETLWMAVAWADLQVSVLV